MQRRSFLARAAATAGVTGLGAAAGCLGSPLGTDDTGPPPYADRLYDPAELTADTQFRSFASYDLATVYDRRDVFPEEFANTLAEVDTANGALSVPDLERATALGFWREESEGDDSARSAVAGGSSVVVRGSFDSDALYDYVRRQAPDDVPVRPAGTDRGHDLYTVPETGDTSAGYAVSEETVFAGVTEDLSAAGEDAVRAMLESTDAGYYRTSDTGSRLVDALGDPTTVVGWEGDVERYAPDSVEDYPASDDVEAVVTGLRGAGSGMTLGESTVSREVVGVYAAETTPSRSNVQTLLDLARQGLADRAGDDVDVERLQALIDDTDVTVDGRTVRLAVERETSALFEGDSFAPVGLSSGVETLLLAPALVAAGTFVIGIGSDDDGGRPPENGVPTPSVSLEFEFDGGAGEVTVTHAGGDALTAENTADLVVRSGSQPPVPWELPVQAGDSVSVPAESGTTVVVLWTAPGGERTEALGQFEVP